MLYSGTDLPLNKKKKYFNFCQASNTGYFTLRLSNAFQFQNLLNRLLICCRFQADRLAAGLLQLGLSPGDRLGIWGPNSSEWFISRMAAARAGLIAVSHGDRS
jgi:hypothetical protein